MRWIQALIIPILVVSAINIAAASSCFVCDGACLQSSISRSTSFYYNSTDSRCHRCPTGCLTCDNPTTCSVCSDGYILSSNKTCIPCLNYANCLTCDTSTLTCSVCKDGYYMDSSGACKECSWLCVLCTESSSCLKCNSTSSYLDSNSVCQVGSVTGCSQYTSPSGDCEACLTGYAFSSGSCVECPNSCDECDATGTTCTKCSPTAYYDNSLSKCVLCSGGCKSCTSNSNCLECEDGFTLTQNGGCTPCSVSNCKKCLNDGTMNCLECDSGWAFNPITKLCTSCPFGCTSCSVGTYDADTGMCLNTTASSGTSEAKKVGAAVGGALGAVAAVSLIAGVVIFIKMNGIQKALRRLSMIPNNTNQTIPQVTPDPEVSPLKGNHSRVHPSDSKRIIGHTRQFSADSGAPNELETGPR